MEDRQEDGMGKKPAVGAERCSVISMYVIIL